MAKIPKLTRPRTKVEDFDKFAKAKHEIVASRQLTGKEESIAAIERLKKEFEGRVFPEDEYLFDSLEDLNAFFDQNNLALPQNVAGFREQAAHANQQNLEVQYGAFFVLVKDQVGYSCFLRTRGYSNRKSILDRLKMGESSKYSDRLADMLKPTEDD